MKDIITKIRAVILTCIVVLSAVPLGMAKNLYVAQNSTGSASGADAADANSLTWLNSAGNWGSGAQQVSPRDTVHLVGTFTSALTLAGSGTAGNPVTIYFEPGANFTTGCWASTGAIALNGQSNITIDGGGNGLIQNTSNGTGLATSSPSAGILGNVHFCVIKNLTITNIYNRIAGAADCNQFGNCINVSGSSITISNCNLSDACGIISYSGPQPGDPPQSNILVLNNLILNWCHGITVGIGDNSAGPQNVLLSNIVMSGNFLDHADKWDGCPSTLHMDGVVILNSTDDSTVVLNGLWIYQNVWGPNFVSSATSNHGDTAAIAEYLDGGVSQCQNTYVFNNVFQAYPTIGWADGFVNAGGSNIWVVNNTSESIGSGVGSHGAELNITGTNAYCYNNILRPGSGISLNGICGRAITNIAYSATNNVNVLTTYFGSIWSDHNAYSPDSNGYNNFSFSVNQVQAGGSSWYSGAFNTLQGWQTWMGNEWGTGGSQGMNVNGLYNFTQLHCDPHSTTNFPLFLPGSYVPAANDSVARSTGTNLILMLQSMGIQNCFITNDFNGNPRPTTGPWDIGAYIASTNKNTNVTAIPLTAPTNLRLVNSTAKNLMRVQYVHTYPGSTATITPTAGNTLVVAASCNALTSIGVSDNQGNTWNVVTNVHAASGSSAVTLMVATAFNVKGTPTTVTASISGSDMGLTVVEYSGCTAMDTSASASGIALAPALSSSSIDMFFGAWANENTLANGGASLSPGAVPATAVEVDSHQYEAQYEWLNSAAGFAPNTYTFTLPSGNPDGVWVVVGLQ